MKAILIDDEQHVINSLKNLIQSNFNDIDIIGTANNITEGYELIQSLLPDIVFLDINLPDGTGFDLIKKINQVDFKIIFITGHEEYAIQAFKVSAIDYILKPVVTEELVAAINKARESIKYEEENLRISTLLENINIQKTLKRIILRTAEYMHLVNIEDIIRCEADNNYTFFYLKDGNKILVSKTIKEFSKLLGSSGFIRVHQSHLINTVYIDKYVKGDGGYILMKDNTDIPISQHAKQEILKKLEQSLYK
jgi:two-component system LytT family response regulator